MGKEQTSTLNQTWEHFSAPSVFLKEFSCSRDVLLFTHDFNIQLTYLIKLAALVVNPYKLIDFIC